MSEHNFSALYDRLNPAQRTAVDTIYGPVMVIAGPGTGKTQIIALRTANLLRQSGIDADNILITTFTEAGVLSIKKRLLETIGQEAYRVTVSTIHSFCNDVIQTAPERFLAFRASRPIDEIEQIEILESLLDTGHYEVLVSDYDKHYYLTVIRDRIAKLKQEWVGPDDFLEHIRGQQKLYEESLAEIDPKLKKYEKAKLDGEKHIKKLEELRDIFTRYEMKCQERGVYDFADMIRYVERVFATDADLRATYAERYQFIMLDEYQDTNNAQNRIIESIAEGESPNILVVGDDDQSIYRFQGANLENMFHFSQKYQDTKFIVLTTNYRSTQPILDLATESISHNEGRISRYLPTIDKTLHAHTTDTGTIDLTAPDSLEEEKCLVLSRIQKFLDEGIAPEEIAIILRTNREVEDWTRFLETNNIAVESRAKSNILDSDFIRLAISIISTVTDPYADETGLIGLLRSGIFDLDKVDILSLNRTLYQLNYTRKIKLRMFDILCDSDTLESIGLKNRAELEYFRDTILSLNESLARESFHIFFKRAFESTGFLGFIEKNGTWSDLEDLYTLLWVVKSWNEQDRSLSPATFLRKIGYYEKYHLPLHRQILKSSAGWVQVMTAHQSKGLEYGIVCIPGLYHGNWWGRRVVNILKLPLSVAGSSITGLLGTIEAEEEEKRLFFVALTRAKRHLFLSFPKESEGKSRIQSVFLEELPLSYRPITESVDLHTFILNEAKSPVRIDALEQEEWLYIKEFLKTYRISPSDLNTFLDDPKRFLRDTIFRYPFEDNEFTIFGKVYHKTLEMFYLEYKKTGEIPPLSFLEHTFTRSLSREILTPDEADRLREKWLVGLGGWYALHANHLHLPAELEYNFRPRNILLDDEVPITGKIDKIEHITPDSDEVYLIDYKTGRTKSLNEIKGNTASSDGKYFRQLLFYKILADLDTTGIAPKYRIAGLGIDFVEGKDGKYAFVPVDYTPEDIERVKTEIHDMWTRIHDREFWKEVLGK